MSGLDLIRETPLLRKPAKSDVPTLQSALLQIDRADYDNAISMLNQIVSKTYKTAEVFHWLGYCHKQKYEYPEALKCYQKFADLNPGEMSYFFLGEIYYLLNDDDQAGKFYQRALTEIDYDSPYLFQIYKNLGNISVKQNDFEAAQEFFDKAFTINSHSDDLIVNYGTLEIQKQNLGLALERFKQALDLNLYNDKAWVGLALIYRKMSDFNLAWADLQKALDVNPHNQVALRICLEWALQDMNYEIARSAIEKFLKLHPNEIEWRYIYAGLLFQIGMWVESLTEATKVLDNKPDHTSARELIKNLAYKMEN